MTEARALAEFVDRAHFRDLSGRALEQLKIRVLDSLGVAIGALSAEPIAAIGRLTAELGGQPLATLIGGGKTAPDRAAFFNGALVRYLDFMDSYLAKAETNHPSDNLGAVLAAANLRGAHGTDFLVALAAAYQIQTRLSDVAPVRSKGFDHTVHGAYSAAAGVAKVLALSVDQIANAVAISGTANNALRVTRTGAFPIGRRLLFPTPQWRPLTPRCSPPTVSPGRRPCSKATRVSRRPSPGNSTSIGRRKTWSGYGLRS